MKKLFCLLSLLTFFLFEMTCQEALKSIEEEYYDTLSLLGYVERPALGYRTLSDSKWTLDETTDHVWKSNSLGKTITLFSVENQEKNFFLNGINQSISIKFYGPEWYSSYNKDFPYGQNDGLLWQGTGYNTSFTTGIRLEGFGFEATFKPQIVFSQNKDWDYLTGAYSGQYGYFTDQKIDIVQRYGDSSYYTYGWGDSEIRWTWNTLTVGFGTQSPWLGTSYLNPMLGSNNADPYPKLDLGIRKTPLIIPGLNLNLGDIEARIWLGKLTQSDYFTSPNKNRMISMGSVSYSPSFINGFSIGMNRLFMNNWKKENLSYLFRLFDFRHKNATGSGNDEDQKVALYADWLFPETGFEVYGELGIDDYTSQQLANPFHTAIYTLGVKQVINHSNSTYGIMNLEWNNFEMSQDFQLQWAYGGYYFHGFISQGFTNNGQIIGAGTGSMGNSQYLSYSLYYPKGNSTLFIHRYCQNNNYIFNKAVYTDADTINKEFYADYETYCILGLKTNYFLSSDILLKVEGSGLIRVFPKYSKNSSKYESSLNASFSIKYVL